jgi:hypothetical protein
MPTATIRYIVHFYKGGLWDHSTGFGACYGSAWRAQYEWEEQGAGYSADIRSKTIMLTK